MEDLINMADILDEIVQLRLNEKQFCRTTYPKDQIVIHNSNTTKSASDLVTSWNDGTHEYIAPIIIDRFGTIYQTFSSRFHASHIGDMSKEMKLFSLPNRACSQTSIAVMLMNGGRVRTNKELKTHYDDGTEYKSQGRVFYENLHRGNHYYEEYTKDQIKSLERVLKYWCNRFDIPATYNEDIWEVNTRALKGDKGIYLASSFSDDLPIVHPQKELLSLLKNL